MNDGRMQWVQEWVFVRQDGKGLVVAAQRPCTRADDATGASMAWIKPLPEKLGIATKAPLCLTAVTSNDELSPLMGETAGVPMAARSEGSASSAP